MSNKKSGKDDGSAELFSRIYLRPAASMRDSERFRRRIFAAFGKVLAHYEVTEFSARARLRLGANLPTEQYPSWYETFFLLGELRDVLDCISIIHGLLAQDRARGKERAKSWHDFITTVFEEEALGYVFNPAGGVRYVVDEEYERNRFSTIDGLGEARYAAVKHAVESAFGRLDGKVDRKAAVREMFEAVEILAKLMAETNEDLDERMVQRRLKPIAQRLYKDDVSAQAFSDQMLEGLAKWVSAGHKYRHGQKTEEPLAPPLHMTVAFLSSGASHIRFLVSLDSFNRLL